MPQIKDAPSISLPGPVLIWKIGAFLRLCRLCGGLNLESIHLSDLMLEGYDILMVPAIEDFIQRKTDDNPLKIKFSD